jgi:hypothetical protein
MGSFLVTADRNSVNNDQPNLISFSFVYFVSFIFILQPKFKSGITTNTQTSALVSITQVVHFSYLVLQVGEEGLKRSRPLNLPGGKNKT